MNRSALILAGLLSIGAVSSVYAKDAQPASNRTTQVVQKGDTGSDPATELPYAATRGRPEYARGEAQ